MSHGSLYQRMEKQSQIFLRNSITTDYYTFLRIYEYMAEVKLNEFKECYKNMLFLNSNDYEVKLT